MHPSNTIVLKINVFIFFTFSCLLAQAEDSFDLEFKPELIEQEQKKPQQSTFFEENIFGSIGYNQSTSKNIQTKLGALNLGVRYDYEGYYFLLDTIRYDSLRTYNLYLDKMPYLLTKVSICLIKKPLKYKILIAG